MHILSVPPELQWSVCSPSSFLPPFQQFGYCLITASPLTGKDEKFTKGERDDAYVRSRGASTLTRQVLNADFLKVVASPLQVVEQFGVDHSTVRL